MAVIFSEDNFSHEFAKHFHSNAVFVCRTDTVYGIQGVHGIPAVSATLQQLKQREDDQFITLVANLAQAEKLAHISDANKKLLAAHWPGPYTFILPGTAEEKIALRVPDCEFLQKCLTFTGPLWSTSCNLHGEKVAETIEEAVATFWDKVTFYIDGGTVTQVRPSTLVDLTGDLPRIVRDGAAKFPRL